LSTGEPGLLPVATSSLREASALPPPGPSGATFGDQRIEYERRVADHGMIDSVFLVDVAGVVGNG
jgi:hypothetical protein